MPGCGWKNRLEPTGKTKTSPRDTTCAGSNFSGGIMGEESIYRHLGVDPQKSTIREIFGKIVDNDFPRAFVNIVRDPDFPGYVFTKHPDGDGSKGTQRVLHMLETGDPTVMRGIVDDGFEMNFGDIAASGFVSGKIVITQIVDIFGLGEEAKQQKEVILRQIGLRVAELLDLYRKNGFDICFFTGGETADLPNQVSSMVYNADFYARTQEKNIITGDAVQAGDAIYGFASTGRAAWETEYNFGLMSNGSTQARLFLMSEEYNEKYPRLVGFGKPYQGRFRVTDPFPGREDVTVSQALLSPTRNWSLVIKMIIDKCWERGIFDKIHGISLNTGGGATKIQHVGQGIIYEKEMPYPPELFELIREESGDDWNNMFESFNCGIGIDVIGENHPELENALVDIAAKTKIRLFPLGYCRKNSNPAKNKIILKTPFGTFDNY
jgi:phosphoribosylformylglycinamidine cyclo-ligase